MRCQHKGCGGLILKQERYGPYPERLYCSSCGREPRTKDLMADKGQISSIEKLEDPNHMQHGNMLEDRVKICATCKVEKGINEFGILRSSEDGHNSVCLECRKLYFRESRKKQPKKEEAFASKPKIDKLKMPKPPQEKIIAKPEEITEADFIRAFKKDTISVFVKNDLIPMLERLVEERFP
jgi:hypothetical protein